LISLKVFIVVLSIDRLVFIIKDNLQISDARSTTKPWFSPTDLIRTRGCASAGFAG
jgi:hypothetical protein